MSVATTSNRVVQVPSSPHPRQPSGLLFRVFIILVVLLDAAILAGGIGIHPESISRPGWALLAWAGFVALLGLVPIQTQAGPELALDLPVLLASGFLFGPLAAGALAFVAYVDLREIRGEIPHSRATYNRAQTSLSVMAAALAFQVLGGEPGRWPLALLAGTVALVLDILVNYSMVTVAMKLSDLRPFGEILATLRLGSISGFLVTYACFGLLGLLLTEVASELGLWGLFVFGVPVLLARQAFSHSQGLVRAQEELHHRGRTIEALSTQMEDERRDERLVVASGLHDDVLPSLHQVHLMGQVLRQDLAFGRLLELEDDLPQLLAATEAASESIRRVIMDLRESPIGPGGLESALGLLAREIELRSPVHVSLSVSVGGASPSIQLLIYQVARESLRNAAEHSGASQIDVGVECEADSLRLIVRDNGRGFNPKSVDAHSHFGLELMRDRIELLGGAFHVESEGGHGTTVVARLPLAL